MKNNVILVFILLLSICSLYSESVNYDQCRRVMINKLAQLNKNHIYSPIKHEMIQEKNNLLGYVFELNPQGYIVVSASDELPPVIAYSFTSNFFDGESGNVLLHFLQADLSLRLSDIPLLPEEMIIERKTAWEELLNDDNHNFRPEQWPPEGSTPTGGWLLENWTQSAPYNNFCPLDTVTGGRSIAGCPSIAMSQILNYHRSVNSVIFNDDDDYYHNYAGRQYWIDNDYQLLGFLSFPQINEALDSLTYHYQYNMPVSDDEKAALVFACGVAAQQVYTSQASGTFGVSQAYDAFLKFNFDQSQLIYDTEPDFYDHIAQNIMDGLPVHFASVTPTWDAGHNFVVDGYNTDEYFHLNFGWGGTQNGWYLLPDEIPYGLTVVEGAIVDIVPEEPPAGFISGNITLEPANTDTLTILINVYNVYNEYDLEVQPDSTGNVDFMTQIPVGIYDISVICPDYECITINDILIEEFEITQVEVLLAQLIAPNNLTGEINDDEVTLTWQHDTIRSLEYYRIYRNINESAFAILDTTSQLNYIDDLTGMPANSYSYYVTAVYAQENESHSSETVTLNYNVPVNEDHIITIDQLDNYPNPFNPSTTITFSLYKTEDVTLTVYNIRGQQVRRLVDRNCVSGKHSVIWNGEDENGKKLSSGIYLYKLQTEDEVISRRMLLLK